GGLHPGTRGVHPGHLGGGHDLLPGLLETALQLFGYLLILHGDYVGHEFHHGDLGPQSVVEIGEFDADGTAAHHDHFLGLFFQGQGLAVADDLFAVLGKAGKLPAPGPGGDDDMVRRIFGGLAILGADLHFFARFYFSKAVDHLDLVLFHQELHALAHSVRHPAAPADHGPELMAHIFGVQSIVPGMLEIFEDLGGLDQGLGGDAAPVQTDPAQIFLFYNSCLETQLGSPDSRYISPGATAQNNYIKLAHSKVFFRN